MSESDFHDVLDTFDTCMLLTFTDDGTPHARPMAIAGREDSAVYFVTGRDTPKVEESMANDTAVLTAQDSRRWATATGTTAIVDDPERLEHLWSKAMEAWFPDGPQTPGLVLLRVDLRDAEWWDVSGGRLASFAWGVARSLATGERIDEDREGERGRTRL
jgi:general stress protein 26